jgi:carbamoyltransferase
MLSAGQVIDERLAPVRHVDGTVRYQIVNRQLQPAWYELIQAFGRRTGIFAIVNTSFNTLGEPLVETPMDAVRQFLLSGADALIAQGLCLARADIPPAEMKRALRHAWKLTPIDPLAVARGLEDAGYADAAIRLLEDLDYTAETAMAAGLGAICRYHALQLRAAVRRGALERARHHADVILRWSGLPPEAMDAAIFMSEDPDDDRRRLAGRLIGGLAMPGGALRLFSDALRAKPSR